MILTLLHQAGALSYEKTCGCNSWLDNKVPSDTATMDSVIIPVPNNITAVFSQIHYNDADLTALSNTNN